MTTDAIKHPTLASHLFQTPTVLHHAFLALVGSLLLTLSAKISVPFWPVPITMQTFVVLAIGFVYGWKLGGITILLYLAEGAMGLPVFQGTPEKGIGLTYMMGPTGGYLAGFVLAAMTCGWLAEKGWDRKPLSTFAAMIIGNAIIYALGLYWLGNLVGWDKPVFEWGMKPFLVGDLFKIGLAMLVIPAAWKTLKK